MASAMLTRRHALVAGASAIGTLAVARLPGARTTVVHTTSSRPPLPATPSRSAWRPATRSTLGRDELRADMRSLDGDQFLTPDLTRCFTEASFVVEHGRPGAHTA